MVAKSKKTTAKKKTTKKNDLSPSVLQIPCLWSLLGMILAGIIFFLDQLSKWIVLNHLMVPPQTYPVTSFFNIVLTWNRGVSFGMLSSNNPYGPWALALIAFVFASLLVLWIWRATTKLMALAFGMVLGGAVGNLIDRVRFGAVTDFLDFHAYGYHWYTFNIADAAIVTGVTLILFEHVKELYSEK